MRFCYFLFFLLIITCSSCNYLSVEKKTKPQDFDTVIDFTRVDVSPSFNNCKKLLDTAKTNCFRNEIQKRIAMNLKQHHFATEYFIDETIRLDVLIDDKGKVKFLKTSSSKKIKLQLPKLDSLLQQSISNLPIISPAIKRGIPVATQYQLPIRILTK